MPATYEELLKIARDAVAGNSRPSAPCEGLRCWHRMECALSVRNPASYDPPEWVLDAMRQAFEKGRRVGAGELALGLYPEGG